MVTGFWWVPEVEKGGEDVRWGPGGAGRCGEAVGVVKRMMEVMGELYVERGGG